MQKELSEWAIAKTACQGSRRGDSEVARTLLLSCKQKIGGDLVHYCLRLTRFKLNPLKSSQDAVLGFHGAVIRVEHNESSPRKILNLGPNNICCGELVSKVKPFSRPECQGCVFKGSKYCWNECPYNTWRRG